MTIVASKTDGVDIIFAADVNAIVNKIQNGTDYDTKFAALPLAYTIFKRGSTHYATTSTASGGTNYSHASFVNVLKSALYDVDSYGGGRIFIQRAASAY